ncbi:MAG: GTPase ObgE [Clostridia bacterium]|jgi:GTP-binding protein
MFIDEARIYVKAGKGGNGASTFRREKYEPSGGPDGGDGGKGGDIIFIADNNIRTLIDVKYNRKYLAQDGMKGMKKKMTGKSGEDTIIKVPVGTLISDMDRSKLIIDLNKDQMSYVVCKGGRGGRGNTHFATSTRQTPEFSEAGEDGEEKNLFLELKLLADVALIGMPSVGKSTLISVITSAKPKIADYHFTTLSPNLGVVKIDDMTEFVVADIPGLIEGASDGAGLGHEFLKHIERTKLLVHLIDASETEGRDAVSDFEIINDELAKYNPKLYERHQICVLNKIDLCNTEEKAKRADEIEASIKEKGYEVLRISAVSNKGTVSLIRRCSALLKELPDTVIFRDIENYAIYTDEEEALFTVRKDGNRYYVEGNWPIKLVNSTNIHNTESLRYFQRLLKEKNVIEELEKLGIEEEDIVVIDEFEFEYIR